MCLDDLMEAGLDVQFSLNFYCNAANCSLEWQTD